MLSTFGPNSLQSKCLRLVQHVHGHKCPEQISEININQSASILSVKRAVDGDKRKRRIILRIERQSLRRRAFHHISRFSALIWQNQLIEEKKLASPAALWPLKRLDGGNQMGGFVWLSLLRQLFMCCVGWGDLVNFGPPPVHNSINRAADLLYIIATSLPHLKINASYSKHCVRSFIKHIDIGASWVLHVLY